MIISNKNLYFIVLIKFKNFLNSQIKNVIIRPIGLNKNDINLYKMSLLLLKPSLQRLIKKFKKRQNKKEV